MHLKESYIYIYIYYIYKAIGPKFPHAVFPGVSWCHSLSGQHCPSARGSDRDLCAWFGYWIPLIGTELIFLWTVLVFILIFVHWTYISLFLARRWPTTDKGGPRNFSLALRWPTTGNCDLVSKILFQFNFPGIVLNWFCPDTLEIFIYLWHPLPGTVLNWWIPGTTQALDYNTIYVLFLALVPDFDCGIWSSSRFRSSLERRGVELDAWDKGPGELGSCIVQVYWPCQPRPSSDWREF